MLCICPFYSSRQLNNKAKKQQGTAAISHESQWFRDLHAASILASHNISPTHCSTALLHILAHSLWACRITQIHKACLRFPHQAESVTVQTLGTCCMGLGVRALGLMPRSTSCTQLQQMRREALKTPPRYRKLIAAPGPYITLLLSPKLQHYKSFSHWACL